MEFARQHIFNELLHKYLRNPYNVRIYTNIYISNIIYFTYTLSKMSGTWSSPYSRLFWIMYYHSQKCVFILILSIYIWYSYSSEISLFVFLFSHQPSRSFSRLLFQLTDAYDFLIDSGGQPETFSDFNSFFNNSFYFNSTFDGNFNFSNESIYPRSNIIEQNISDFVNVNNTNSTLSSEFDVITAVVSVVLAFVILITIIGKLLKCIIDK